MKSYLNEYQKKLRTPEEAVKVVKSGDHVDYVSGLNFPTLLDEALSKRRDELTDVSVQGNLVFGPIKVVECDPEREHFYYSTWHCSKYERDLVSRGLCNFTPMVFRLLSEYYVHFLTVDVAMIRVPPMDEHGYFNLSCSIGVARRILELAKVVIVEVDDKLPKIYGGFEDSIHLSEVDYVVEGEHGPLLQAPVGEISETEKAIARNIIPYIVDGATIQLGIGGIPTAIGEMLAESDLKDLGMHTELCSDAYVKMFETGVLTNRRKSLIPGRGVTGLVLGTDKVYEWVNENPGVAGFPLEYVNKPANIEKMDNMVSINSCIRVDLFGQVTAESVGTKQISGTGGQLDFLTGASEARGGKAFICVPSSYVDKAGNRYSNITATFAGDIITDPRSQTHFVVTEFGAVNLVGRNTWERAELLISVAHPEFRDELIKDAEKLGIWKPSNKR